ncbi:restriction endonuclease subunit S [Brevibacterium aurantiacum]|uniref:restriction endonuclease subunit S n=1 Tax=Brevibacterium aurantiacum TaxID=273384 RepID=UPI001FFC8AB9|nr:restriction endonuclease subunit S [Brevibacterium aurantiacum]
MTASKMKTIGGGGPIRVFAGGQTVADVAEDAIPAKNIVRVPSIIVKSRGHIGFSYYERPFTHKTELWSYTIDAPGVDQKFVYYYLLTQVEKLQVLARATSVKLPQLSVRDTDTLNVPMPPFEVQREIVRVLDKFTQLEAELEAELDARRTQYDYYAGELLTIDEGVRRVRIGDVATIVRGASPRPIQKFITSDPEGVPWIKIGDVPADGKYITSTAQRVTIEGAAKSRRVLPGDFVLSNSMSFGRPYVSQIEGCIHDGWLAISAFEDSFERDYLYYLLRSTPVQEEFARRAGAGTVKNLNADIVRSVVIPVPPRAEQKRVIDLLDHFDALVNDIRIGLPAELAARRKQYEYYRDRLLTFKETV